MNHSIIALKRDKQYLSIICHHPHNGDLGAVLRAHYSSRTAANRLIALGDLNHLDADAIDAFHRDWGYTRNETLAVRHASANALVNFCESINAEQLHLFNDNEWETIRLTETAHMLATA